MPRLSLSLTLPEVRSDQVSQFMGIVKQSGGHGVQVEFVSLSRDNQGAGDTWVRTAYGRGLFKTIW